MTTYGDILLITQEKERQRKYEKAKDYRIVLTTCQYSTHHVSYYVIYFPYIFVALVCVQNIQIY